MPTTLPTSRAAMASRHELGSFGSVLYRLVSVPLFSDMFPLLLRCALRLLYKNERIVTGTAIPPLWCTKRHPYSISSRPCMVACHRVLIRHDRPSWTHLSNMPQCNDRTPIEVLTSGLLPLTVRCAKHHQNSAKIGQFYLINKKNEA